MSAIESSVLVVEDNSDDLFLLQRAIKKAGLDPRLQIATDGQQAVDYLSGTGKYADRAAFPIPRLILLDLKLPYLDGFDVLAWMRADPGLRELPVVILTSSSEDRDRKRAEELDAKAYLVKPPSPDMLLAAFRLTAHSRQQVH